MVNASDLTEVMKTELVLITLVFFAGLTGFFGYRLWQVKQMNDEPFIPRKDSFDLKPPKEALKGKIATVSGEVKIKSRGNNEFKKMENFEQILQGERLVTLSDGYVTVLFDNFAKVSLMPSTEIAFVSLIPSRFLINQVSGMASYQLINDSESLAIRSLHSLFELEDGEALITTDVDKGLINIVLKRGTGKIALVDLENKTQVWQIKKGQRVRINDTRREVKVSQL